MKKRFICLLLTLVMLVSLIPATVITASAASSVSEAGVRVIKQAVGFHKDAYEIREGVWRIGYGTPSVEGAVIDEKNADQLLRAELQKPEYTTAISAVNGNLVQTRFDALVWMTYIDGDGWRTAGSVAYNAVKNNLTGSALAHALTSWGGVSYDPNTTPIILNRRMAMVNLYLHGSYSASNTGSLGYTVFDPNNGSNALTYQVFDANNAVPVSMATPSNAGKTFLGWYVDTTLVTYVGGATMGKTLKAMWQEKDNKVPVNYSIPAGIIYTASGASDSEFVPVLATPADGAQRINVLYRDNTVQVVAEKIVGTQKWLELSTGGWVKLCNDINSANIPPIATNVTVTILEDYVNLRMDPNATATKLGTVKKGETRTIVNISGDKKWGYCSQGWIFLAYTTYSGRYASSDGTTAPVGPARTGVISGTQTVNIRSGAGVQNGLVTTLNQGTAVTVYEQQDVNGAPWGRIGDGRWVAMMYVTLNAAPQDSKPNTNVNRGTSAVVNSKVNLVVRTGPGANYAKVDGASLVPGTSVVILRTQSVGGVTWGQIDQGWINLNYVTVIGSSSGSGAPAYGVTGTVVNCSTGVNVRSGAGPTNALVGVAILNSKVTVTEITNVNGFDWGHIGNGWVCMDYIRLDSAFNPPNSKVEASEVVNDLMTVFAGYPAKINNDDGGVVREEASAHAKVLMTLSDEESIMVQAFKPTASSLYVKVTIGNITGWINADSVELADVHGKVTAATANTYEAPSTRSKFFAALTKDTQLTIKLSEESNWKIADGIFWGKMTTTEGSREAWINMADVTMFRDNVARTGITTLNGVGYLTGYVAADTVVRLDASGNVGGSSNYTLNAGQRVNILARNLVTTGEETGKNFGKVSVGSIVGWIDMDNVVLDHVQMKGNETGTVFTVIARSLEYNGDEINNQLTDMGQIYLGDDITNTAWIDLDDKLVTALTAATLPDNSNPFVSASVIVSGKANGTGGTLTIMEEADENSEKLLTLSNGTPITILNWNLVAEESWGKVQVNKIVGWVKTAQVDFTGLSGVVKNSTVSLYNNPDKASSVQILRMNEDLIKINTVDFDGRTVWGEVFIGTFIGWVDMSELNLGTPTAEPGSGAVIATGRINSVNTEITNASGSAVASLPKGTSVNLTAVKVAEGVATWTITVGDKNGTQNMDYIDMNSAVATVVDSASISVYADFQHAGESTYEIGKLYRGESTTVNRFKVQSADGKKDELYGEITYNNESAWILLCEGDDLKVALVPGATNNNAGNTNNNPTTPSETTPPVAEPTAAYIVCSTTVNVRSGAGVEYPKVTALDNGKVIKIYEKATSAQGVEWARIDEGWVCMDYVRLGTATGGNTGNGGANGAPSTPIIVTTVPAGAVAVGYASRDLEVYGGAGFGYGKTGTIVKNKSLVIYENTLSGGVSWGRTDSGWVIISYVVMTGIGQNGGTMGTIGRCGFTANVRSSANGLELTKVMINSRVAILETSGNWARTPLGWISTDYIVMDSEMAPLPQDPTNPSSPVETTPATDNGLVEVG